ncbi:MAG: hypothetical protein NC095_04685 [Muribaculum sp.]|nr:hypothetical protein [Muribaculum sp.]
MVDNEKEVKYASFATLCGGVCLAVGIGKVTTFPSLHKISHSFLTKKIERCRQKGPEASYTVGKPMTTAIIVESKKICGKETAICEKSFVKIL